MESFFKYLLNISIFITVLGCNQTPAKDQIELPQANSGYTINQIQVIGTHNSYSKPIDSIIQSTAAPIVENIIRYYLSALPEEQLAKYKEYHPNDVSFVEGLNYSFPDFPSQLDAGIRSLELDVYNDPKGGLFSKPAAFKFLKEKGYPLENLSPYDSIQMKTPGFKLMHIADFDFRSHYPTLESGLQALKQWSTKNPKHLPIFILVEAKDSGIPIFPDATQILKFDPAAFDALDQVVFDIIGKDHLITPDQIRGNYPSLNEAVKAKNWPNVKDSRGKFVFLLIPSGAGLSEENLYVAERDNLEGRAMFVQSNPEDSYGAFLLLDNAIVRHEEIKKFVKEGYLVRTRADIETYEAKINDLTRANKAISSGAQIISTDFYTTPNPYGTPYKVAFPEDKTARLNPLYTKE